ncbi:hypothetical protein [Marinicellulosiphila megalodicopiae]|uniref:hypothetical protein n=1 Tax=Marinicellulosiphila megalodicopiae TaxID=2724896 RepID=UPI003BAE5508
MKYLLAILGILVALIGSSISYCLLIAGKLSGGEFVAFTLGLIVVGIAIGLMSEISELSIAGNVIKLRQVKAEAEQSIEVLKESQKSTFKFQLALSKRLPGGFSESGVSKDARIDDFWFVYSAISDAGLDVELANEIYEASDFIARGQVFTIQDLSDDVSTHIRSAYEAGVELPSKSQIAIWAMDENSVNKSAKRHRKEVSQMQLLIFESLEEYGKLLEIRGKYYA